MDNSNPFAQFFTSTLPSTFEGLGEKVSKQTEEVKERLGDAGAEFGRKTLIEVYDTAIEKAKKDK
jgi:hypothetical protein